MSFDTTRLVGSRVMVVGTDTFGTKGQTVLDSTQWDEVKSNTAYDQAIEAFDAAVADFFAPILEAAEATAVAIEKPQDPSSYVVLSEAVEGVEGKPAQLVHLNNDSIVLRLIESGDEDRLVWVDGGLEVLELAPVLSDDN
jgi:hypothetical protein